MKITLAKSAGFCFGVARAVKQAESYIENGVKACTLGPLIHNPIFVNSLSEKGVYTANVLTDVKDGYTLIIRTHGITKNMFSEICINLDYTSFACLLLCQDKTIAIQ